MFNRSVFIFILLLASCGQPAFSPLSDDATILAFGDSLTQGVGVSGEHSYPSVLENLTQLKVINAGVSGEVTQDGAIRFNKLVEEIYPDLIILLEGGNDIIRNHSFAETKKNLAKMIMFAQQKQIPVILIGVPQKKLFSDVAPFYRELAEEFQLVFDDEIIAELMRDKSMKSDPIHFNQLGYQKLAERIDQILRDNGAL